MGKTKEQYHEDLVRKFPYLTFIGKYTIRKGSIEVQYDCGCIKSVNIGKLIDRGDGSKCKIHNTINSAKNHDTFVLEVSKLYPNIMVISRYTRAKDKVDIRYSECGHEHSVEANSLLRGHSSVCRICNNSTKSSIRFKEELLALSEDLELLTEYAGANSKITVKYKSCGHSHTAEASSFLKGLNIKCKVCTIHKTTEQFKSEMLTINPSIEILGEYYRSKDNIKYMFRSCGHIFEGTPSNLLQLHSGTSCLKCNPSPYGKLEKELHDYVSSIYKGWIVSNDRHILEGKELDIVLPDLGIAIEFNGIYWHSTKFKDKNFHLNKTNLVEEFGYRLIHVFENDWVNSNEIVKSRIAAIIGVTNKIYARKCTVREISWATASEFLERCHLYGAGAPTKVNIGLFLDDTLVAVQTFSTPKIVSTRYEYELVRYACGLNTTVVGGASKLLKYFVKVYKPNGVFSYSDRCWSTGGLYKSIGFKYSHTTAAGYSYFKGVTKYSRYNFQKHKLLERFPEIYSDDKTEGQIMDEAGYLKVYDSGNDVWVLE